MMDNTTLPDLTVHNITEPMSSLQAFALTYADFHGYASICVCLFGIVTNLFNISVLTRKHMKTPVNQILTGLAVSDILTMTSYIPFAFHFYCQDYQNLYELKSYRWMSFLVFHVNLTATTHTISIWMCVILAIVRYLHIKKPTMSNIFQIRRLHRTRLLIMMVYIASSVILIPNYLSNELYANTSGNITEYSLQDLKLGRNDTETKVLVNVWVYAVSAKLVPCALMIIFGSMLIYNIHVKIRQRRKVLQISGNNCLRLSEHSRTTKMLLTVIILFVSTELPQGILIVCSACVNNFFQEVYIPLGDVMDIVALVNNSVNFVLYCSMSTKFRQTFVKLYCGMFRRSRTRIVENGISVTEIKLARFDSPSHSNRLLPD